MALLEFARLGYEGPACARMVQRVFSGLRDFYEFQKQALDHLEQHRVHRVGWKLGAAPAGTGVRRQDRRRDSAMGVWVELVELSDDDDLEELFDQFVDSDSKGIYEAPPPPDGASGARRRPRQPGKKHQIQVLDGHRESVQLCLSRLPELPHLLVWPNTAPLKCQLDALQQLSSAPRPYHKPLLQLFERGSEAQWPAFTPASLDEKDWYILRDTSRPGTASQRAFVCKAVATPDFAILEGPPGSGKTTAICELILQVVRRKPTPGRVLLCASTHVAVDNVLERLTDPSQEFSKWINPLRIGDEDKAAPSVRHWLPKARAETDTGRLKAFLRQLPPSPSRQHLAAAVDDRGALQRFMLETSNVVCGTTIGILQLKRFWESAGRSAVPGVMMDDQFDMLIVDEASKTSFQEFLVPALMAKRWILIGDPRQLSPYVDEEALQVNLEACVPTPALRDACVDVFLAAPNRAATRSRAIAPGRQRPTLVVSEAEEVLEHYRRQAAERGVSCVALGEASRFDLAAAGIILASAEDVERLSHLIPLDVCTLRGAEAVPEEIRRQAAAWRRIARCDREPEPSWAGQVAYRLVREYEQRFRVGGGQLASDDEESEPARVERLRRERNELLPAVSSLGEEGHEDLIDSLVRVRRVAFPSMLETLQFGFKTVGKEPRTAMTDGLPPERHRERHVLLEHQHRMHPEIAAFPREHVYGGKALITDPSMELRRKWSYEPAKSRARWLNVTGPCTGRQSRREADAVVAECVKFVAWAASNPRPRGVGAAVSPVWEVAVLSFYRAQERMLRERLRERFRSRQARHLLEISVSNRPVCVIKLCTVDRFQGQEADFVLLSIANDHSTVFLESLNRLNVAITRARYLLTIVGNRRAMQGRRSEGTLLHRLATSPLFRFEDSLQERSHGT
ncbi:MAG: AAA domain-containing protein [Phycisphaerales bacterium]